MPFPAPGSHQELESENSLTPKFAADGLVTAVAVAASDNEVLMVAHMNAEALELTLQTGIAHYWSRSRGRIWKKGETSGNVQNVLEVRVDCDQDAVVLKVETQGDGANCHTGRRSCFYRSVAVEGGYSLVFDEGDEPRFDPQDVYSSK